MAQVSKIETDGKCLNCTKKANRKKEFTTSIFSLTNKNSTLTLVDQHRWRVFGASNPISTKSRIKNLIFGE